VQATIQTLSDFSKKYNLWQATINHGLLSIEKWMKESPTEYNNLFPNLRLSNFLFENLSQQLILFQHGSETFILRTKYSLFTDKQKDRNMPIGTYALDVDENGKVVDDWLIFEQNVC